MKKRPLLPDIPMTAKQIDRLLIASLGAIVGAYLLVGWLERAGFLG